MVLRDRPEDYGLLPDGDEAPPSNADEPSDQDAATRSAYDDEDDMTVREALHSQAFWMVSLVHGIAVMSLSALAVHQIERMVQAGVSLQMAGLVVTIYTGVGIFFRIFSGYIADIFDKRYVIAGFLLFQTAALLTGASSSGEGGLPASPASQWWSPTLCPSLAPSLPGSCSM